MKTEQTKPSQRFSLAERTGFSAFSIAALLALVEPILAVVPLTAFIILCAAAPFFPTFGFFLPIISRGRLNRPAVALTFDDGPDPITTPILLELLSRHRARATFFVTGRRAERYPDLIRAILNQGHAIGNHSFNHDNFIMFRSCRALKKEIVAAQHVYRRFGITPLTFRPPVGITNPRLAGVLDEIGLCLVNFNNRAADLGNRRIKHLSRRILRQLRPNDIILLHDTTPKPGHLVFWRNEIQHLLIEIQSGGLEICSLAELIGRPVMQQDPGSVNPELHQG